MPKTATQLKKQKQNKAHLLAHAAVVVAQETRRKATNKGIRELDAMITFKGTQSLTIRLPQLPWPALAPNYSHRGGKWVRIRAEKDQRETWLGLLHQVRSQWEGVTFDGSQKVSITITVRGAGNRMDVPNWVAHGAWKILIDCLTQSKGTKYYGLGILMDDSPRYVSAMAVKVEPLGDPETEIVIEVVR